MPDTRHDQETDGKLTPRRLILFDVDGTLIARGDPAHLAAIDAGLAASYPSFGVSIRDIDFDGKVDRQILRELLRTGGIGEKLDVAALSVMLEAAATAYRESWQGRSGDDDLLPGVRELVERLAGDYRFALGLLTGGVHGIVVAKLTRLALEHYFPVGAFGDEVEVRNELLPLALARADHHYGTHFEPNQVVVVGDTPNDVAAAHAHRVACLAVATGRFTFDELRIAGAEAVLPNLAETQTVINTLLAISPSELDPAT